ncbi:MAG: RAMP superfamily CRISPR-associated protein [Candidatus Bathyarchaeia archaeon]
MYRIKGSPCTPGSSLKGALRSLAESLAKSMGIAVHDPWDDNIAKEKEGGDFCAICGIFGNTKLSSHVRIYDSTPRDSGKAKTFSKYGIAIDRDFRSMRSELGILR